MCYTHTHAMEWYSATKSNVIMPTVAKWMQLEIIMFNISPLELLIINICSIKQNNICTKLTYQDLII